MKNGYEPVPTAGTPAATSPSGDNTILPLVSNAATDAAGSNAVGKTRPVRARPLTSSCLGHPPRLMSTRYSCPEPCLICAAETSLPRTLPRQVASGIRPNLSAPMECVWVMAPASCPDTPEILSSATKSAPAAEPNEALKDSRLLLISCFNLPKPKP